MSSKSLQLQLCDFLEHLMTCSTNSTKFHGAGAIPNRALLWSSASRLHCIASHLYPSVCLAFSHHAFLETLQQLITNSILFGQPGLR
jgi:hypothetical protein